MFTLCWAVKGGSGTSVIAASLALGTPGSVLAIDLAGDLPAVIGLDEPAGPGVHDWVRSTAPADRLHDLASAVTARVSLVHAGTARADLDDPRWAELAEALAHTDATVVVDAGTGEPPPALHEHCQQALLVTRPCYLSLRRAVTMRARPTGVVLVSEPGRCLQAGDVAASVGAPVVASVSLDPAIARAVDAGLLRARVPRVVVRALRRVAA